MKDTIYRADAIEAIIAQRAKAELSDYNFALGLAEDAIRHLPSAEAVQGEWIKNVDGNGWNEWYVFKCPFCGATIEDKQYRSWEYNFCPNCGAKMKGGDSE